LYFIAFMALQRAIRLAIWDFGANFGREMSRGSIPMIASKLLAGLAASLLVASPALANQAASLSLANASAVKASTPAKKSSRIAPEVGVGLGLIAVAAVVVVATTGDDSDSN